LVEVVTRGERRRSWSAEQKRMIVVEAMQPGAKAVNRAGFAGGSNR
jgi:transposase-like protein